MMRERYSWRKSICRCLIMVAPRAGQCRQTGRRCGPGAAGGYCRSMILSENGYPLFGIMLYCWSMIFSENRYLLFGIMLYCWSMIFSENRYPLFGIML